MINKIDMIAAMKEVSSIEEMAKFLKLPLEEVTTWSKLYTVIRDGRERSIWNWLEKKEKKKNKDKISIEEIEKALGKSISISSLASKLNISVAKLNKLIMEADDKTQEKIKSKLERNRMKGMRFGR
jgi:hypothetical protein